MCYIFQKSSIPLNSTSHMLHIEHNVDSTVNEVNLSCVQFGQNKVHSSLHEFIFSELLHQFGKREWHKVRATILNQIYKCKTSQYVIHLLSTKNQITMISFTNRKQYNLFMIFNSRVWLVGCFFLWDAVGKAFPLL